MPKIIVEGPDGRKFAFPDTMPRAEINAFMKQKYGTKAREESVNDYLARVVRETDATEARAKAIDKEATAAGYAEGARAAERMGIDSPLMMAFAAPAIGLAQQEGGRQVYNREGTVLADEAGGLAALNAMGAYIPGLVNPKFGARVEEGRRQQPFAAFAGDVAGGFLPGEIIGAGVAKAAQAIGPSMAAVGRMFSGKKLSPEMQSTLQQTAVGSVGGSAYGSQNDVNQDGVIDERDAYAGAVAGGIGVPAAAKGMQVAGDVGRIVSRPRNVPGAMPAGAGGYFGRQSMRPPGSGPSPREIELRQQWSTATPIVTQARTTAQTAQQAADAALQSKAPADIARAKDQKKTLVSQLQEAQASRAGMDTPEDARLAETLASLNENTSDPVLLSTQISAAKTSLDRLLTDIGSPSAGNLIPVRTTVQTRTQAPRSAAEGPQERPSVTRYAEGEAPPIKGMGFAENPASNSVRQKIESAYAETEGLSNRDIASRRKQAVEDYRSFVRTASADELRATSDLHFNRDLLFKLESPQLAKMMKTLGLPAPAPTMAMNEMRDAIKQAIDPTAFSPLKPMGFGASTPKTPESTSTSGWQVQRRMFGNDEAAFVLDADGNQVGLVPSTAGKSDTDIVAEMAKAPATVKQAQQSGYQGADTGESREWLSAVRKGLPMDQAGRLSRARDQGYNTDKVYYHGTDADIYEFKTSRYGTFGEGVYLDPDPAGASHYAQTQDGGNVLPVYVKGKIATVDDVPPELSSGQDIADWAYDNGFAGYLHTYLPGGSKEMIVFDPKNIRSINAAFDPEKSGSSTLLAAAPFAAVSGAGLTSERELGSKMKREKKD